VGRAFGSAVLGVRGMAILRSRRLMTPGLIGELVVVDKQQRTAGL
jgi:hypothetical protein